MKLTAILAATAVLTASTTHADSFRASTVHSHPSQGDVTTIANAAATMGTFEQGIFVSFKTTNLTPGNVHTLWFVAINEPAACETPFKCTSKDVLKRTEVVDADVGYGGGTIVGSNGAAEFAWYQPMGALNGGWFGNGLGNTDSAEIHLVINDHGPAIEGRTGEMLSTYRDGCTDESIPAPMPDTARAQGEAGPNTCRLVQFSIFRSSEASS